MSAEKKNMEDFLREKMDSFDTGAAPDWDSFEPRLERALMFQRIKQGALVSIVLIILGIGALYTTNNLGAGDYTYYKPRKILRQPAQPVAREKSAAVAVMEVLQPKQEASAQAEEPETTKTFIEEPAKVAGSTTQTETRIAANTAAQPQAPESVESSAEIGASTETSRGGAAEAGIPATKPQAEEAVVEDFVMDQNQEQLSLKNIVSEEEMLASQQEAVDKLVSSPLKVQLPLEKIEIKKREGPYISPLQEENPWSYSLNVYPNFTFRKFEVDPEKRNLLHRDFIDAMQVSESGGMSLNIGFKVSRRIGPITYINSGVEYISYKTEAFFKFTNFRDALISPETGEIDSYEMKAVPEQINFTDNNIYHYLNIPFSISHQPWASEDIRLNMEAGGSLMYFLTARGKTIDYQTLDIIDLSERDFRNSMGSFFVKVGATYHLNEKFNFGFEPTLMYFTNTIYTEDYPFRVIPYSVGMNLKLQMKLN